MTASDKSLEVLRNVVADALLLRRVRPAETQGFSKLKHNAHLCPGVEERLDQVLLGVSKRVAFTSDIQGFNDHGVDVLITIQVEGGRQKYIAIQIKSEDEAADRDLFRTLKAGYVDATSHYYEDKLLDYYIFLGWDARGKLDRIRNVTAELATLEKIRVIDPVRAWAFFSGTTDTDIDALVTASVTDDDPLLREARRTTASLSHSGLATLLIALATWVWEPGQSINSSSVEGSSFRDRIIDGAAIVHAYELGPVDSSIRLPPLEGGCPLTRKGAIGR